MAPRLLVVEDNATVRLGLCAALTASGYEVTAAANGVGIDDVIDRFRPDLAIVDVMLGCDPDGFALGRRIHDTYGVIVMFLTAADAVEDRLRGFDSGADDYIVKPFAMAEVLARLRAVLRRSGREDSASLVVRDLLIDERNRIARRQDATLELTHTEFDLLVALARNADITLSKIQLLTMVWGFDRYAPNLVEVHISALRRKLEAHGPRLIHTARGAGYVLRS